MNASDIAQALADKGQPMTLSRETAGVFDPITSSTTGAVVQTWPVFGLILSYKDSDINAPNSLIMTGDEKIMIGADIIRPLQGDSMVFDGESYAVISVKRKRPQGADLFYFCQCRK